MNCFFCFFFQVFFCKGLSCFCNGFCLIFLQGFFFLQVFFPRGFGFFFCYVFLGGRVCSFQKGCCVFSKGFVFFQRGLIFKEF